MLMSDEKGASQVLQALGLVRGAILSPHHYFAPQWDNALHQRFEPVESRLLGKDYLLHFPRQDFSV